MEITWLLGVSSENSDCTIWLPLPARLGVLKASCVEQIAIWDRCALSGIPQVCRVQMASLAAKLSFLDGVVNSQSVNRRSSVAQGKIKAFLYSFECPRYICLAFLGFQDAAMAIGMKLSLLQRASSLYGSSSRPQDVSGSVARRPASSVRRNCKVRLSAEPIIHPHNQDLLRIA